MKIKCSCDNIIFDSTDYIRNKGYLISDTQWFHFWNSIDEAIEKSESSTLDKEESSMKLRKLNLFKTLWECKNCGKLFVDGKNGNLISYSSDNTKYNRILDKKEN